MRTLVIGHDHVAGLEHVATGLAARGHELRQLTAVSEARFAAPDVEVTYPPLTAQDLVVTLGAPWPREQIASWASDEVAFLRDAHAAGVAVIGVCFGAQLLAEALGGGVHRLAAPRIGWRPVQAHVAGVAAGPWFQWHSDGIVPPPGAEVLAESDDGVEVFRFGRSAGVQFHPEMTPRLLERWLDLPGGAPADLDVPALRRDTLRYAPGGAAATPALLDVLLAGSGSVR